MKNEKLHKENTFRHFNWKWRKVPKWAEKTENIYRQWYLTRYGYKDEAGLREFLKDKFLTMDAGCGLGRDSKMFLEMGAAYVIGVDQSKNALKVCNKKLAHFGHRFFGVQADITTYEPTLLSFDGSLTSLSTNVKFDFISCDQVLHHTFNPGKTLKHFFSILKKGGIVNFSVCKRKNPMRDLADEAIFKKAAGMNHKDLWRFSKIVTEFGKALHDLNIDVVYNGKKQSLQRFVHYNLFRCWYHPDVSFKLSISCNYDWFSNNPIFSFDEVQNKILSKIKGKYKIINFYEDEATLNYSIQKVK